MSTRKGKTLDFEQALGELEAIVDRLEHGDLPLEEALRQFERGVELARDCQARAEAGRAAGGDPAAEDRPTPNPSRSSRRRRVSRATRPALANPPFEERLDRWRRRVEHATRRLAAARDRPRPAGCTPPSATARSGPASASAPRSSTPRRRRSACRSRRVDGAAVCGRADPRLLARARRPAGDGRRRPAPRPPDLPPGVRRGDGDPRRRLAAGAGVRRSWPRTRALPVGPGRPRRDDRDCSPMPAAPRAWPAARRSTSPRRDGT